MNSEDPDQTVTSEDPDQTVNSEDSDQTAHFFVKLTGGCLRFY